MPYDLCIDVLDITAGKQHLIELKGLKKNQPLPAKGTGTFQTQNDVRPGKQSDRIRIPVYYGEIGTRGVYNDLRGEVIITGEQLPGMLPEGSDVELTIEVDESRMIKVSACFPYLDDEMIDNVIEKCNRKTVSKDYLERELKRAHRVLENLEEDFPELGLVKVEEIRNGLNELGTLLDKGGYDADTRNQVFDRLQELFKKIDKLESSGEWPKVMQELTESLKHLEETVEQYGNENARKILEQFNKNVKITIENQDIKMAKDLDVQIRSIAFKIADDALGPAMEIGLIKGFDDNFGMHDWKNRSQARQLVNEAKAIIASRPTKENLRPIVGQLFGLLPQIQQGIIHDEDVLIK